jgi:stage V sporulation protein AB
MRAILLWMIGAASGIMVAAGLFTFLAMTGVPHRLMAMTHTTAWGYWYEWMLMAGGILGNIFWLGQPQFALGMTVAGIAGLMTGIFVGCLIGAIAEVLDAFPVFMRRAGITRGVAWIIVAMALGKAVGAWLWYFVL